MTRRPASTDADPAPAHFLAPPSGMRDLLPSAAEARAALRRTLSTHVASYGYEAVVTPVFELAEVLERGLATVDRRDLLRFVEPDTGEVALLRPDITPQIARIVATSLAGRPAPYRLAYEGTLLRRRRGRARKQRQIYQVGGECIGPRGPAADVEVLAIAARGLEAVGLQNYRIELAQVRLAEMFLRAVPSVHAEAAREALAMKDVARLEGLLAGVPKRERARLLALPELYGGPEVLKAARKALGPDAEPLLRELEAVVELAGSLGLAGQIGVDLGELRGQAYYTGVSFSLLSDGPGEPVGGGGRYDGLLARFGRDLPATGFGLDLENVEWALRAHGVEAPATGVRKVLVRGPRRDATADALRREGLVAATFDGGAEPALAYATSWGYHCVVEATAKALGARALAPEASRTFQATTALAAWVRAGFAQ